MSRTEVTCNRNSNSAKRRAQQRRTGQNRTEQSKARANVDVNSKYGACMHA